MNRAGRIMAAFGSALMCRHGEGTFERGQYEALIDAALRAAEEAGR
jgi:hypothetical protein